MGQARDVWAGLHMHKETWMPLQQRTKYSVSLWKTRSYRDHTENYLHLSYLAPLKVVITTEDYILFTFIFLMDASGMLPMKSTKWLAEPNNSKIWIFYSTVWSVQIPDGSLFSSFFIFMYFYHARYNKSMYVWNISNKLQANALIFHSFSLMEIIM